MMPTVDPADTTSWPPRGQPGEIMCALCGVHTPDTGTDLCPACWADVDIDTLITARQIAEMP